MISGKRGLAGRLVRQTRRLALTLMAIAAAVLVLWLTQPEPLHGMARVIDGDSIEIGTKRIRLVGIDAPEYRQICHAEGSDWPCGRESARFLGQSVAGRSVICRPEGTDRFGRVLAECYVGDQSLNRLLVSEGWALAFGDFQAQEREAARGRKGLWRGTFERPSGYRRENPRVSDLSGVVWGQLRRWIGGAGD